MFKLTKYALAVMSGIALTACGGGGGSSGSDVSTSTTMVSVPVYVSAESDNVAGGEAVAAENSALSVSDVLVCLDENEDLNCTSSDTVVGRIDDKGYALLSWESDSVANYENKKIIAVGNNGLLLKYSLNNVQKTVSTQSNNDITYDTLYLSTLSSLQDTYGSASKLSAVLGLDQTVDFSTVNTSDSTVNNEYAILQDALYQIGMAFKTTINGNQSDITFLIEGSYAQITKALANDMTKDNIISQIKVAFGGDTGENPFSNIILPNIENAAPVASFAHIVDGLTVTFTNNSSDSDGDILEYTWSFGDGSANEKVTNPTHTYSVAGTYQVNLIVNDGNKYSSTSVPITVTCTNCGDNPVNTAPVALFSVVQSGLTVKITNSSTDKDGDILSYNWNMGDGKSLTNSSSSFSYTYGEDGTYTIVLKASDGQDTSNYSKTVSVKQITDCSSGVCSTECPANCEEDPCSSGVCSTECPANCADADLKCTLD
jgi:PKD repeat protein